MTVTEVQVTKTGSTHAGHDVSVAEFLQQASEPSSVTRSQIYYWSERWQEGEQESLRELKAGDGVTFDSGEDLVSWLLEEEPPTSVDED